MSAAARVGRALALTALVAPACSEPPPKLGTGAQCTLSSECQVPLVCRLGRCREECATARDCQGEDAECVRDASGIAACRLESEGHCTVPTDCPSPLVCVMGECGNECVTDRDCPSGAKCITDGDARVCDDQLGTPCVIASRDCMQPYEVCATDGTCRAECITDVDCHPEERCEPPGACVARSSTPAPSPGLSGVAAGGGFSCARSALGDAFCWGDDMMGQLGDGMPMTVRSSPGAVTGLGNVIDVAAGDAHACALRSDGTVACWGANPDGRVGDESMTTRLMPVTLGLANAIDVDTGGRHSCAVLTNGSVLCWGDNTSGQLGDGTTTSRATPMPLVATVTAVQVSLGDAHSCALDRAGAVWCWGTNEHGQLGNGAMPGSFVPAPVTGLDMPAAQISAGHWHTCAVLSDGGIRCWGSNSNGQLGDGSAAGDYVSPVAVAGLAGRAARVSAGGFHTCAALEAGPGACWGYNVEGELGDSTMLERRTGAPIALATTIASVAAGRDHSCALGNDATLWCWGRNNVGQLGIGSISMYSLTPQMVVLP